jgi:uncharacterized membrane protein (DUF2068 family)
MISARLYLPFELNHLAHHPTLPTLGLIFFNIAIIGYLGKLLADQRARRLGPPTDDSLTL